MPQERKKRGRREELKRKAEDEQIAVETAGVSETSYDHNAGDEAEPFNQGAFFGLLDDQELAYFAGLDTLITSNQFDGEDEKDVFATNTFAEIQGRELKIATSPSSRFLEKLIFLLRSDQLLALARELLLHWSDLIHRPSASFCCEALILSLGKHAVSVDNESNLPIDVLCAIGEQMSLDVTEILSHSFASHVLRMYLLVLTGSTVNYDSKVSFLQKKQKDDDSVYLSTISILKEVSTSSPTAFQIPLNDLVAKLSGDLDTSTAQDLALSPTSSPVLQIITEYELISNKGQDHQSSVSLLSRLLPSDDIEGENSTFMQTLSQDPAGSHLMEILVAKSPGRIFKKLHRSLFDGKLLAIAQSKTAMSYVLVKALERFSSGNLQKATHELSPGLHDLVQSGNTNIITALIENCRRRQVDTRPIVEAFRASFGNDVVKQVLGSRDGDSAEDISVHVSILLQTMLASDDGLRKPVISGLGDLTRDDVIQMSKQRAASRIIQAALTADQPSNFRRQLVSKFLGTITELGQDNIASHVVDSLWTGSSSIKFLRDRLINEVLANEHTLHQTIAGRAVCRNWRKWSREIETQDRPLTAIDKARKRHAMEASDKRKKARVD